MIPGTERRKLAAIMFTDMVGYSALTQRNEALALELLQKHRCLLRPLFHRFNGTEVKTIGDAFLVEFHSALEAAQCAIEMQRTLAKRNHDVSADRRIELKIGIHIGDVVHRDGDVLGDGVNIASRIEPLAGPGGICVSIDVERQIRNGLEARFEKLGPTELKNIQVPMEPFRIVLPWEEAAVGASRPTALKRGSNRRALLAIGAIVLGLLASTCLLLWRKAGLTPSSHSGADTAAVEPGRRPGPITSLAVLPLLNLSREPDQDYFVDGITELLCTELAGVSSLQKVTSRTTIMQYKGTTKKAPEIARELGVEALVEGSVQREGNRLVASVQLIEGAADRHLWATNYECEVSSVLKLKTELARVIAAAIQAKLTPQEQARLANARPVNPEAFGFYLKGRFYWSKRSLDGLKTAIDYCRKTISLEPDYAPAHALLGDALVLLPIYLGGLAQENAEQARSALTQALQLDPTLGEAHTSLGFLKLQYDLDLPGAQHEFERALELAPNSATAHHRFGLLLLTEGRFDQALAQRKRAEELDPLSSIVKVELGDVFFFRGQYDEAITRYREVLVVAPDFARGHWMLGRVLAEQGKYDQAIAELQEACRLSGNSGYLLATLGRVYALAGKRAEAQKILNDLQDVSLYPQQLAANIAVVHLGLGNKDEAFRWIEKTFEDHFAPLLLNVDPQFESLRSDPRFKVLLRKIGLDR